MVASDRQVAPIVAPTSQAGSGAGAFEISDTHLHESADRGVADTHADRTPGASTKRLGTAPQS